MLETIFNSKVSATVIMQKYLPISLSLLSPPCSAAYKELPSSMIPYRVLPVESYKLKKTVYMQAWKSCTPRNMNIPANMAPEYLKCIFC